MVPFTPFGGTAVVKKRPKGPYEARFEAKGEKYSIEWTARQMGGEKRIVETTPVLENALENLRQRLNQ
jgi:hypothetical protein